MVFMRDRDVLRSLFHGINVEVIFRVAITKLQEMKHEENTLCDGLGSSKFKSIKGFTWSLDMISLFVPARVPLVLP